MNIWKTCPLPAHTPSDVRPLRVPLHYMCFKEQQQIRQMNQPLGRPAGDHRSAESIIEQSPLIQSVLKHTGNYSLYDPLKRQVGDWTDANPDPEARANAAYDLDKVLRFIDNADDELLQDSTTRNGNIDGFYNYGFRIVENSEASLLRTFASEGYYSLRYLQT